MNALLNVFPYDHDKLAHFLQHLVYGIQDLCSPTTQTWQQEYYIPKLISMT